MFVIFLKIFLRSERSFAPVTRAEEEGRASII